MQRLPIELLEADMVIAREVVNDKGAVLVAAGTRLDDRLIMRLESLRVRRVFVQGTPVPRSDLMPMPLTRRLAEMEAALAPVLDDPLMQKFRVILKAHFIGKEEEARAADAIEVPDDEQEEETEITEDPAVKEDPGRND